MGPGFLVTKKTNVSEEPEILLAVATDRRRLPATDGGGAQRCPRWMLWAKFGGVPPGCPLRSDESPQSI
jgi:hypothetical protein